MMKRTSLLAASAAVLVFATTVPAALLVTSYSENFDSMGTSGTTPPTSWALKTGNSGTSNLTWQTSIPANGTNSVASMIATAGALTATSAPTATNNNGYNAAFSTSLTSDRVLATSPTTVSGAAIELSLTNGVGADLSSIVVSYDTRRFTSVTTANELPGYQLFFSLDGTTWTNVAALNPTLATVPNTVGVTSVTSATVNLGNWADASTLLLRWVDDNANQTSPDQIIGLNNVVISAGAVVPEPTALGLVGLGGLATLRRRK
jgi:PEP-CTERM motif